jgi:hypothetical protein
VVVSTWDTEEQAQPKISADMMAGLQALGLQPEPIVVFEVTDQI